MTSPTLVPLKLIVYVAGDRPVVSTPVAAVRELEPLVATAADAASFAQEVERARDRDGAGAVAQRRAHAEPYDSEYRIEEMEAHLAAALERAER